MAFGKIILLIISFLLQDIDPCTLAQTHFERDMSECNLQYFSFGMLPIDRIISDELQACCDVKVSNTNCSPTEYDRCYNQKVAEYYMQKTGKRIENLFLSKN